jgi:hypothetical protein
VLKTDPDPYYCSEEGTSKAEALTALWFYASNVPTGFVQYLQPVWHLVLESLNIGFPAEVKKVSDTTKSWLTTGRIQVGLPYCLKLNVQSNTSAPAPDQG